MSTFENLKKSNDNLSRLLSEVDKINTPKNDSNNSSQDDRFWRPELDKSGNGYAVIRFLPESEGEELPWVRIWNHGFQGPTGKWYIENSLTTLNQKDPVSEYNSVLWNSGTEANKEIARKRKRNTIHGNSQTTGFSAIRSVDRPKPTNTRAPIDRALKISLEAPAQIITIAEAKVPII